jgi:hypothetical protein
MTTNPPIDHDRIFKELLSTFFLEFLELFVPTKTQLISQFVDTYLRLNAIEEQVFQTKLDTMGLAKKEAIMQTLTSWEERGMEKGQRSLVSLQLEQKVGQLPDTLETRVAELPTQQLEALAIALLQLRVNQ